MRPIQTIKEAVPIESVAGEYTELKQVSSREYLIRCPMPDHEDRNPSCRLYASPEDPHYHCHACQAHGDVIDLEELCGRHADTWTAVVALSVRYGVELPERSERWHEAQGRKAEYRRMIAAEVGDVLKERLFGLAVVPVLRACYEDSEEYNTALERAWERFQDRAFWPAYGQRLIDEWEAHSHEKEIVS